MVEGNEVSATRVQELRREASAGEVEEKTSRMTVGDALGPHGGVVNEIRHLIEHDQRTVLALSVGSTDRTFHY